ncbi:hypothetical protein NQT76_52365, partial [Klebsiella sp. KJ_S1]|nr:hypothetical protein [Klebsiella sp. KJ_S1]
MGVSVVSCIGIVVIRTRHTNAFIAAMRVVSGHDGTVIRQIVTNRVTFKSAIRKQISAAFGGLAPIFPYTFYHLTHYWFAAADIPVANDTPVHYADAIRCNVR